MQSEIEIALRLQMFYSLTAQCSFILQFYLHNNIYECLCVCVCVCVCVFVCMQAVFSARAFVF